MGLDSYLKSLMQAIGGGQSVAPINPNTAQGQPASLPMSNAQPSGGGLPPSMMQQSALDNPLLQGALGAYFSAIGSPRMAGLGGMLSRGGLGGLQAYQQAREHQLTPYIAAAQLGQMGAQTAGTQASTQKTQAETSQLAGIKEHNASVAASLRAAMPNMTPEQQQRAEVMANSIANDGIKAYAPDDVFKSVFTAPIQEKKDTAEAGRAVAETGLVPARKANLQASTSELGTRQTKEAAEAATGGVKPKLVTIYGPSGATKEVTAGPDYTPPGGWSLAKPLAKPPTPEGAANIKAVADAYTKRYGPTERYNPWSSAPSFEEFAKAQGVDPNTGQRIGSTTPTLPPGASTFVKMPDGTLGYRDAKGDHPYP